METDAQERPSYRGDRGARRRLKALAPPSDEALEKQIAYFENQQSRMLYKTYREQGLFYGSGVVEAGCKAVIGQRLKESGMFWTRAVPPVCWPYGARSKDTVGTNAGIVSITPITLKSNRCLSFKLLCGHSPVPIFRRRIFLPQSCASKIVAAIGTNNNQLERVMRNNQAGKLLFATHIAFSLSFASFAAHAQSGFTSLFDGHSLNGWNWRQTRDGYGSRAASSTVPGRRGNLLTENEYSDFILRFEFKLEEGSNNGIGIRAPLEGDAAYMGMEIQVLDDNATQYAKLRPAQYHGSIYDVIPANGARSRKRASGTRKR